MKYIALFLAMLPTILRADSPPAGDLLLQNVISAVGPSWNTSGNYKAVLVREGEYAALYIYRGPYDETPVAYAPHAAITGDYWGTVPWLEFNEAGTLLLHSENRAYGRNKWEATLSILERNGAFIVSAFYINTYDSTNPDAYTECEIDFLMRTLTVNSREITPFPLASYVPLETWNEDLEGACYTSTSP